MKRAHVMRTLREWLSRLRGTIGGPRSDADLAEELRVHEEFALEDARRHGASAPDRERAARLRIGGSAQAMDALRDQRGLPWLDALTADAIFGLRQLRKHRTSSVVAVLSVGLAMGATTAAFRLVDAVLLRPLPVADPERLFVVVATERDAENRPDYDDSFDYPTYRQYGQAAGDRADLLVVGFTARQAVTIGQGGEPEPASRQFVSGNLFAALGLRAAAGRLLTTSDDVAPGQHPVAVISHDYWTRRFGRDPAVVGTTFRAGARVFEVVGIGPEGFTGTEPGNITDYFVPATMNTEALDQPGWSWFRIWARPRDGVSSQEVRDVLHARFSADRRRRAAEFPPDAPRAQIDAFLNQELRLLPAGSGVSEIQKTFRGPLVILGALAGLVLLLACANVASLQTGQALARTGEMALRVSLGAARRRLLQLVLVEGAMLALAASLLGALFATWAAPLVVSMLAPAERPIRLVLGLDWRIVGFASALTAVVTILFGLAPALRAAAVPPAGVLATRGTPRAPRLITTTLIGAQLALCVFLVFAAGLFVSTLHALLTRPLGFSAANLLIVHAEGRANQSAEFWKRLADEIREMPGIPSAAVAGWPPLSGNRWTGPVRVPGGPLEAKTSHFVSISSGYFDTMHIELFAGRDFRPGDAAPGKAPHGVAIVNETFARVFFDGQSPVGRRVIVGRSGDGGTTMEIVGLVRDAVYFSVREPMRPTAYLPLEPRSGVALMVRTDGDPQAFGATLRREVPRRRPDLRVRDVGSQSTFVAQQMLRERLLAILSTFFAAVALALAALGLYGVLDYRVVLQRREIGIRLALGATAAHIVRRVTAGALWLVCIGSLAGGAAGVAFGSLVQTLLYQIAPTDPSALAIPILVLVGTATIAALRPALRAIRTDPALTLRME